MGINRFLNKLPELPFQTAEDFVDLSTGVYLRALHCRVTATVSISGGASDGTLLSEHMGRLIDRLRVVWDGEDLVDASGRMLRALSHRLTSQDLVETELSGAGTGVSSEAIELNFIVPFARDYLANSFETVLPPLDVQQQLRAYVQWSTATAGGSSDAGTGALISGGDRDVTFDSGPNLEITEIYSTKGKAPFYIPVISEFTAEQIQAATDPLVARLVNQRRFDSALLQLTQDTDTEPEDILQTLTFRAGGARFIDAVGADQLRAIERYAFPGTTTAGDLTGYHFIPFADGGKLGNIVNPAELNNPRFELDVSAPSSTPGRAKFLLMELMTLPGVTQVQD